MARFGEFPFHVSGRLHLHPCRHRRVSLVAMLMARRHRPEVLHDDI
jgi:hypothetical protein